MPASIDWKRFGAIIGACHPGRIVPVPRYDFVTLEVSPFLRWRVRPIVIVDGLWLLTRVRLRRLFDLTLFLDAPVNLRCRRRLKRDVAERGYTEAGVWEQLKTRTLPLHARYVEPQKKWADFVLRQPYEPSRVARLAEALWRLSGDGPPPMRFYRRVSRALCAKEPS